MKSKREQILQLCKVGGTVHDSFNENMARSNETKRLLPTITALIERVEQLEGALEFYAQHEPMELNDMHGNDFDCTIAQQALATSPLDEILKGEK